MTRADKQLLTYGIVGSLTLHMVFLLSGALWIGYAAFSKLTAPPRQMEPEVTVVFPKDILVVPAPAPAPLQPPKGQPRYIRTTQNDTAPAPPPQASFQSDRDTVASAKEAPDPKGDKPLPSMKGIEFPTMELANRDYKDGEIKNDSAPSPPPGRPAPPPRPAQQPSPDKPQMRPPVPEIKPDPEVVKKPTPKTEKAPVIAKKEEAPVEKMLRDAITVQTGEKSSPEPPKPKEAAKTADEPPSKTPDSAPQLKPPSEEMPVPRAVPVSRPVRNTPRTEKDAFMPETHMGTAKGTISNRGAQDSVDAAATPSGRYMRQVTSAIEKRWNFHRMEKADFVEPGKMRLHFYVNKFGKPENIRFVFNEANAILTDFTLTSVLEAKIPPIPADLLPMLDNERFEMDYDFLIY